MSYPRQPSTLLARLRNARPYRTHQPSAWRRAGSTLAVIGLVVLILIAAVLASLAIAAITGAVLGWVVMVVAGALGAQWSYLICWLVASAACYVITVLKGLISK